MDNLNQNSEQSTPMLTHQGASQQDSHHQESSSQESSQQNASHQRVSSHESSHQESIAPHQPVTNKVNEYQQVFDEIDAIHDTLLSNIDKARKLHTDLRMRTNKLKVEIDKRQEEKKILWNAVQQTAQFPLGTDSNDGVITIDTAIKEKERACRRIVEITEKLSGKMLPSDFSHTDLLKAIEQESNLIANIVRYIQVAEELDGQMKEYLEVKNKEDKVGSRFQSLSDIFSMAITKN
ncbi:hypothetical protein [Thiofilum flexile]|uniref:hypothetical protein n=1 Tax=Thiofilum flexile TaxID=125627 RepID=UPI00036E3692|nr:hypothetical protein [Thiofilum flexile]